MGTKSRESIYGSSVRASAERAAEARKQEFITKLPKAEHDAQEWQAAMEALLLVAELGGPTTPALNRHRQRP